MFVCFFFFFFFLFLFLFFLNIVFTGKNKIRR